MFLAADLPTCYDGSKSALNAAVWNALGRRLRLTWARSKLTSTVFQVLLMPYAAHHCARLARVSKLHLMRQQPLLGWHISPLQKPANLPSEQRRTVKPALLLINVAEAALAGTPATEVPQ